jgi:hypothetical protein
MKKFGSHPNRLLKCGFYFLLLLNYKSNVYLFSSV